MPCSIQNIEIHTKPSYSVFIGSGLLSSCGQYLRSILPLCRVAVITDSTIAPLYLNRVCSSLSDAGYHVSSFIFPAGESHKNIETYTEILEFLAREHLTRTDCLIALGGGVTGDMTGFAAATYLRGLRYVQMPTTLLAAVDSSVGGKTAIDLQEGKNLVGAFLQPAAVLCDTDCLSTLPPDIFADGSAEAVKTGILFDETLFAHFEQGLTNLPFSDIIARCVAWKASVVERDELEHGERKLLNLGHTAGHAIEVCSNYSIPHGHAVAAGLAIIARASDMLGWSEEPLAPRIVHCLSACSLPITSTESAETLAAAAAADKKRSGDSITLVIPQRIGRCKLKSIPLKQLADVFSAGLEG